MKIKVLIVDDTRTIRAYEKGLFRESDQYVVDEASNGVDALKKIRRDKPHLVLMDIMMPQMDGIECCRQIKSDQQLQDIKVIMVSSKEEFKKVDEAFKAGCDDYVVKPIDVYELMRKVADLSEFVRTLQKLQSK